MGKPRIRETSAFTYQSNEDAGKLNDICISYRIESADKSVENSHER